MNDIILIDYSELMINKMYHDKIQNEVWNKLKYYIQKQTQKGNEIYYTFENIEDILYFFYNHSQYLFSEYNYYNNIMDKLIIILKKKINDYEKYNDYTYINNPFMSEKIVKKYNNHKSKIVIELQQIIKHFYGFVFNLYLY